MAKRFRRSVGSTVVAILGSSFAFACSSSESAPESGGSAGSTSSSAGGAGATSSATSATSTGGAGGASASATSTGGAGGASTTAAAGGSAGTGGASGTGGNVPDAGGGAGGSDASIASDARTDRAADAGGSDATADAAPCNPGATWTIVDDFTYSSTTIQNNPAGDVVIAASGELFVTGIVVQMGVVNGLIRTSANGTNWTTLKEMQPVGSSLDIAPDGTFFASGGMGGGARVVARSRDRGMQWQPVDTVAYADVATACGTGLVAVDSKGVVYSAGSCDTEGWLVRRSTNGGDAWSNVGAPYTLAAGQPARLSDLHVDAADRVFVIGTAQDGNGLSHWIVRRLDANDMWTVVDDYALQVACCGFSPKLSGKKRLYAVGSADTATAKHWIVRRSAEGGGSWTTIDDYSQPAATFIGAGGVYEGPGGQIVAVGSIEDATNGRRVITRRSANDGMTWNGTEDWAYAPGKASQPNELAADRQGNVYGTVRGVAADDRAHWLVRKLGCAP